MVALRMGPGTRARTRWPLAPVLALATLAMLSGCATPAAPPVPVTVAPPVDAGGFGVCHTASAQTLALDLRADATSDARGRPAGIHRLSPTAFLFVWASYKDTLRQDKVTRIGSVEAYRENDPTAPLAICARVDIAAPTQVDGTRRTYDVAVLFNATNGVPPGRVRVLVDWVAGCPCEPLPKGNATATFGS